MKSLINLGITFTLLTSAILFVQKKRLDSSELATSQIQGELKKQTRSTPVLQIRVPEVNSEKISGANKIPAPALQSSCPKSTYYELRAERVTSNWTYCRSMKEQYYGEIHDERFLISIERNSDPSLNADYKLEGVLHTYHVSVYKIRDKNISDAAFLFSETIESTNDFLYPYQLAEFSKNLPSDMDVSNFSQLGYMTDTLCRNIETQEYERLVTNNLNPEDSQSQKARAILKLKAQMSATRIGCKSQTECQCQSNPKASNSIR